MRILITGAGGMLGRDLVAAAERAGHEPLPCLRTELDLTDPESVRATIADARPDAIINGAAWTDVDGAEADEAAAELVNGAGAGHVAAAAAAAGARLVQVSTDYVFDGRKDAPYLESDPVSPLGAYGRTKLAGERAVAAAAPGAAIVRTSWLFGVHGRNFVATMLRLAGERDELRVVDDQIGCPTYTGHLAPALVQLAADGAGGVIHVAAGGHCSWRDFAEEIFRQAGESVRVLPQSTADAGRPAPRPGFSALASERAGVPRLPAWQDGLAAYLNEVGVAA